MAKITQETFDIVVKENMEEFEMSREEAIEDAVKQFEAQGVDLANIVRDLSAKSSGGGDEKHKVQEAIEQLEALLKQTLNIEDVQKSCSTIQQECDIDLAHRCLASSKGAYNTLFEALQATKDNSAGLLAVLNAMCSLCNGQPDLLDLRGTMFLSEYLKNLDNDTECLVAAVKLVQLNCVMHEHNRQAFVDKEIITSLIKILEKLNKRPDIVKLVCLALRTLTLDDDVRVPFGKAHEHAKMIVTEGGALNILLSTSHDYAEDMTIVGEVFLTLSKLAVRNEFCQEITDLGGLKLILSALENSMANKTIVIDALTVLKAIAGNDQVKIEIARSGCIPLLLAAMTRHQKNPVVCEIACSALATVVLRNPEHCGIAMQNNAAETLAKVLILHPGHVGAQKQSCMAIRNLVARTRDYCTEFINLNVEALLQRTIATHSSCHDEAKAALRDLDLKVELKERWTGEGKGIQY